MKSIFFSVLLLVTTPLLANTWTYQVNINNKNGPVKEIGPKKSTFDAGPYYCEVTPTHVNNETEFRSLVCAVGSGTVSTGGLCTRKKAKTASVQYAILNLNGPKNIVNIVVACKFD